MKKNNTIFKARLSVFKTISLVVLIFILPILYNNCAGNDKFSSTIQPVAQEGLLCDPSDPACSQEENQVIPSPTNPTVPTGNNASNDINCSAPGSNVIQIITGLPTNSYPQRTFNPMPQTEYAFMFNTVSGTEQDIGMFSAAITSSANVTKLIIISTCPGSSVPAVSVAGCSSIGTETSVTRYSVNRTDLNSRYYCPLEPGKTYYANVFSKSSSTAESYNCSTKTNCGFFFSAN